ncbi:MAG: amidohydrolase [Gemmatimonadota bacterium]|nr:amidohydrolase [Gemmatimonadota bacterium]
MIILIKSLPLLSLILLAACAGKKPAADLVLKNGLIVTIDHDNPRAQAVAVAGNTIIAVGSNREIERYIRPGGTEVIDLQGKMVCPGFNDAHIHFISSGSALDKINLVGITSYEQMKEKVAAWAGRARPGEWIEGRGWDQTLIEGNEWPTKEILDEAAPDNPVILRRVDGHSALVNSLVLEKSGITRDTPDPEGGTIVRDPATGEPTGIVKEKAVGLIKIPTIAPEEKKRKDRKYLVLALEQAKELGITSIQQMVGGAELFEEFQQSGKLTLRVYLCARLTDDPETLREYRETMERYKEYPLIKFGGLKAFIDGTLGSQTAALFEPFSDNPATSGLLMMPAGELDKKVLAADKEGFQICVHAIGTRGNHLVLNAYQKAAEVNGKRESRHRIEHTQILIKDDLPRFRELGVVASMQPTHCITDRKYAEKRLGRERCRYAYAWKSILISGGRIAFGTDCPVEPMDPMEGLYAAVSRKDRAGEEGEGWFPEEKLTMEQAIELYTLGSAYASFEENIKGSIEPGKLADMVVLSNNLLETPENEIMKTRVLFTIFNGRVIYRNN